MGVLAGRSTRLAELATGALVNRATELVDPARCRMWHGHNRDYAALSEERCRDLIDSLKAQGKQEMPALVRRVRDDPDHDFEVISGARRHWSVSWLRSHNYPEFRFLVEIRELTDEELVARSHEELYHVTRAYEELMRRYQRTLFNVCARYLGNDRDADDVCQEVMLKVRVKCLEFQLLTWSTRQ